MTELSKGEVLLLLVDAYLIEDKKERENFRNKKYKNPFKEVYSDFLKVIQQRNLEADLDAFIYHLGFLRTFGTLEHQHEKDYLQEQFEAFKIDVPEWVNNCFKELDFRTSFIEKFISERRYNWKQEQKDQYKEDLEQELQEFTLNTSTSRTEYLKEKFNSTSEEIKRTESHFLKVYKYDVSNIYKNNKFTATKEDLNNIYFVAEQKAGTINEFWNIHKLLKKYIDLKNQLPVIKEVIKLNVPQPVKEQKQKTPLKEFFTNNASPEIILEIQKAFKDLKKGKEMAILIYLLHKKYELIFLDNNQRNNKSRIHFVRALTGTEVKTIKGINNFFEPITAETTVNEKDEVFLKINNQLKEMVSTG